MIKVKGVKRDKEVKKGMTFEVSLVVMFKDRVWEPDQINIPTTQYIG